MAQIYKIGYGRVLTGNVDTFTKRPYIDNYFFKVVIFNHNNVRFYLSRNCGKNDSNFKRVDVSKFWEIYSEAKFHTNWKVYSKCNFPKNVKKIIMKHAMADAI